MRTAKNWDIVASCLWAGLSVSAVWLTESSLLRAVLGIPLVFLVVGRTVVRALGVPKTRVCDAAPDLCGRGERLAACIFGGFTLHFAHGLNPTGWAAWFLAVTMLACLIAACRPTTPALPPRPSWIPGFTHCVTASWSQPRSWSPPAPMTLP